ncbi:MAG: hypothetical protein Q9164_007925, partial [Protoblastenia rupestris]
VEQVKEIYEINSVMLDQKREYIEEVDRNGKILEKMKMKRPALCDVKGINAVLEACEGWFQNRSIAFVKKERWTYAPQSWASTVPKGWTGAKLEDVFEQWEEFIDYDAGDQRADNGMNMQNASCGTLSDGTRTLNNGNGKETLIKKLFRKKFMEARMQTNPRSKTDFMRTGPVTMDELLGEEED